MNHLAIIPARSGSKGLKDKNIKPLNGKPLLAYSILAAQESRCFSEIMVSTDSPLYAEIAREFGASVPFLRSADTSGDVAGSWDVVLEVLAGYRRIGMQFDTVCLLQPTSPLRKAEDIIGGYAEYEEKKADAVTAVCEMDHSPLWSVKLDASLSMVEFRRNMQSVPRQMLDTYYRINGALYIRKVNYTTQGIELLDQNEFAYVMNKKRSVDIDCAEDFEYAAFLMSK